MSQPLPEAVLARLLKAGPAPVSGETLAKQAGVTRAAVWKAIETLRGDGYEVESVPTRGYRLASSPGALRQAEIEARLTTERFGRELRVLAEVDSTNREAARWAAEGAPEGAAVVAVRQTAGRGRLGRSWFGGGGGALMASLILRPGMPPGQTGLITYVAALSLAKTLLRWLPEEAVEIKWPNDVLVRGRKIAGILLESRIEGGVADFVIVGIGVNVAGSRDAMPEEIKGTAAILSEETKPGGGPTVVGLFTELLGEFEQTWRTFSDGGFSKLKAEWEKFFHMAGREVTVAIGDRRLKGTVEGMLQDGSLALISGGERKIIFAGDVELATTRAV